MLLLILVMVIGGFCADVSEYVRSKNSRVNILGLLPPLYSQRAIFNHPIKQLGIVLLPSNAPFEGRSARFIIIHTHGLRKMVRGAEIVYSPRLGLLYVIIIHINEYFQHRRG